MWVNSQILQPWISMWRLRTGHCLKSINYLTREHFLWDIFQRWCWLGHSHREAGGQSKPSETEMVFYSSFYPLFGPTWQKVRSVAIERVQEREHQLQHCHEKRACLCPSSAPNLFPWIVLSAPVSLSTRDPPIQEPPLRSDEPWGLEGQKGSGQMQRTWRIWKTQMETSF